jgi:alkylation response protein AidB-like acyl-CoA dehydrogenase
VPETRQCLMKLSQCEILDTWYTTGLRGTGSNDLLVDDVFVEAEHTFSFQVAAPVKRPGPLYAFPFMFTAKGSAPALGVARHAIDLRSTSRRRSRRDATRSANVWSHPRRRVTTRSFRKRWGARRPC